MRHPTRPGARESRKLETLPVDLFDWAAVGRFALLVVHAMRRHRLLLASVWLGVVAIVAVLLAVLPKTFEVMTTLQAQKSETIAALTDRAVPSGLAAPTKQAGETVLRHDNLVALIDQTNLLERWSFRRAPILRVKDAIWDKVFRRPTREERIESFVGYLEKQMWVATGEGTVTIGIRFPDKQLAFNLMESALDNFLEARHVSEISSIGDAIAILENRASIAKEALDESRRKLEDLRSARALRLGKRVRRTVETPAVTSIDPKASELVVQVESRRRAIADLEDARRRRITELEGKLQELKALYSATHPAVVDLTGSLEALRRESPQVAALQKELVPLEAELKQRGLLEELPLKSRRTRDLAAGLDAEDAREDEDPEIEYAKTQVRHAIARYNGLLDRIDAARLQEDSAQAAFKYRYSVIKPPQMPRGPIKPKPGVIIIASIVAGFVLGVIAVALLDLTSRKVVEDWQVEHVIGVPLLGEIRDL